MKKREPWKVTDARHRRADLLTDAMYEWQRLATRGKFPRSLHDIVNAALKREYANGMLAGNRRQA